MVSLDEAKNYLRLDTDDDDSLVETLLSAAVQLCGDVARCENEDFEKSKMSKTAVLYTLGYLYEHREEADHHELTLTLRSLLFSLREGAF
jgi:uncharacterized phage protein (predicted DNA packaging)